LNSITIPSKVTRIESNTFEECSNLKSVVLPEGLVSIGDYAFYGCSNLNSINFPSSIQEIGEDAFRSCGFNQTSEGEPYYQDGILFGGHVSSDFVIPHGTRLLVGSFTDSD
jgi:hypothetical protein